MAEEPLNPEFRRLEEVCREALALGDKRPAQRLLQSYRRIARGRGGGRIGEQERVVAREKARRISRLLAESPRRPDTGPINAPPTAATVVNARRQPRDPIANMRLHPDQLRAAREIRSVFEALVRSMMPRGQSAFLPRVDARRSGGDPFTFMPSGLVDAHAGRYLPWINDEAQQMRLGGKKVADIVLAVLIDGRACRELDRELGLRNGEVAKAFKDALSRYGRRNPPN